MTACGGSDPALTLKLATNAPVLEATFTLELSATTAASTEQTAAPTGAPATPEAPASPTVTPTTRPSPTPSPTPEPTATLEPTATATETPVPPTPTVAEGSVTIIWIDFDPAVGRDGDGENVGIQNTGVAPVDMTGWTLSDVAEHVYVFPPFVLQPGATVTVHICAGTDSAEILFWNRCSAIWNNDGDTAYLYDATGRLISTFSY